MTGPALILTVRMRSELTLEEIMGIAEERAPEFEALPGLTQKYYVEDVETGEVGGVYLWDSPEALAEYRESELRASIGAAYRAVGEPRVEVYRIVKTLRA